MDVDSLFARVLGRRWPWYMQMHLVYFSRRTLCEMLRREGFHIVDVRLHTRRVRLSYLASRLDAYAPPRGAAARSPACERVGLAERTVGIKLGDIFTVIARKPTDGVACTRHVDRARASADAGPRLAAVRARGGGARPLPAPTACRSSSGRGRALLTLLAVGDGRLGASGRTARATWSAR